MATISVVINTYNEAKRIAFAIRSVKPWADEVIVVDMYSDDRTTEIADRLGARVILHRGLGKPFPPREFAVQQGSGDWILMLDADEVVPAKLAEELRRIPTLPDVDVAILPRLNYFSGSPIMYSGCDPNRDACPRFFKRGHIIASCDVHKDFAVVPGSRTFRVKYEPELALVHFTYVNFESVLAKFNRYTTLESEQSYLAGVEIKPLRMIYLASKEFRWRYFKCQGYRDGWRGLYISLFYAFYRILSCAKLHELRAAGRLEQIEGLYAAEALRLIDQYVSGYVATGPPTNHATSAAK